MIKKFVKYFFCQKQNDCWCADRARWALLFDALQLNWDFETVNATMWTVVTHGWTFFSFATSFFVFPWIFFLMCFFCVL